jgi:hypothetical protein
VFCANAKRGVDSNSRKGTAKIRNRFIDTYPVVLANFFASSVP